MNQYIFLRARGFAPSFQADERCRGSVTDAAGKLVPILVLPSVESETCRLTLARSIADNLNREAAAQRSAPSALEEAVRREAAARGEIAA